MDQSIQNILMLFWNKNTGHTWMTPIGLLGSPGISSGHARNEWGGRPRIASTRSSNIGSWNGLSHATIPSLPRIQVAVMPEAASNRSCISPSSSPDVAAYTHPWVFFEINRVYFRSIKSILSPWNCFLLIVKAYFYMSKYPKQLPSWPRMQVAVIPEAASKRSCISPSSSPDVAAYTNPAVLPFSKLNKRFFFDTLIQKRFF